MPSRFIQFFEREFGPYFRDISDYDFRFFRTFRDTFFRPTKVIEANDGTYTGELKFVFNIFTGLFILFFVFNDSWIEAIDGHMMWRYPFPHQEYLKLNRAIEEDYYGYIMALAFIPMYFLLLKLFFYRRKPWGFFLSAALYLSAVVFTLLIALSFFLNFFSIETDLVTVPLFAGICIYPVVALRLQHWFWSAIKGICATSLPLILGSVFFESLLFNLILGLSSSEEVLPLKPSNNLVITATELPMGNESVVSVIMENETDFTILGEYGLRWFQNGEAFINVTFRQYAPRKIHPLTGGNLLLTSIGKKEMQFTLYSSEGDTLISQNIKRRNQEKQVTVRENPKGFEIHASGVQALFVQKPEWTVSEVQEDTIRKTLLTHTAMSNNSYLEERIDRPGNHISSQSIRMLDSMKTAVWGHQLYDKSDAFDPIDPLSTHVDPLIPVVYSHYTLANDSNYHSFIQAFDLKTGESLWKNDFFVPVYVSEYQGMASDNQYLYLFGEGHKFYSKWFWQPTYHIGMLVKINKTNGEYLSHLFIGPANSWASHSRIHDLIAKDEKLYFISHDVYSEEEMPWDKESRTFLKVLDRSF